MKCLMTLIFFTLHLFPSFNLSSISKALSSGDSTMLSSYFDNEVTLSILEEEGIFPKAVAKKMIDQFFTANQAQSFVQMHYGQSKGQDSQYCIGNLRAGSQTFRVYIYMKMEGSKSVIQELRFNEE